MEYFPFVNDMTGESAGLGNIGTGGFLIVLAVTEDIIGTEGSNRKGSSGDTKTNLQIKIYGRRLYRF